jgi:hypothetical protein
MFEHPGSVKRRLLRSSPVLLRSHSFDFGQNALLIGLQNLAGGLGDLDTVAIERDMAARDHHSRTRGGKGPTRQRGRWDLACILHVAAGVEDRLHGSTQDGVGARP